MAAHKFDFDDLKRRMGQAVHVFKDELAGLRTGRASTHLLEPITVEAYGSRMTLNQVASVSVPEPRMLVVSVRDRGMVSAVDKAIREANLGLNPIVEGATMRIPIPELTADRRKELVKVAHKYASRRASPCATSAATGSTRSRRRPRTACRRTRKRACPTASRSRPTTRSRRSTSSCPPRSRTS